MKTRYVPSDERGGREYNLALGQRRADAMREQLRLLGVSSDRVETTKPEP